MPMWCALSTKRTRGKYSTIFTEKSPLLESRTFSQVSSIDSVTFHLIVVKPSKMQANDKKFRKDLSVFKDWKEDTP